jgi:hypothetical protein
MTTYRALREGECTGTRVRRGAGARRGQPGQVFDDEGYRPTGSGSPSADGRVVARAAFWGPDDARWRGSSTGSIRAPAPTGGGRHRAAAPGLRGLARDERTGPHYQLRLPPTGGSGRTRAPTARTASSGARRGLAPFVERISVTWTPACGLPPRPGRLRFHAGPRGSGPRPRRPRPHLHRTLDAYAKRDVERTAWLRRSRSPSTNWSRCQRDGLGPLADRADPGRGGGRHRAGHPQPSGADDRVHGRACPSIAVTTTATTW